MRDDNLYEALAWGFGIGMVMSMAIIIYLLWKSPL